MAGMIVHAQNKIKVPKSRQSIMIDGHFEEKEWQGAQANAHFRNFDENSPLVKRGKELIELINKANYNQVNAYIQANYSDDFLEIPLEMHANFIFHIRDEVLKIHQYQITEINSSDGTLKYKSELTKEWKEISIRIEEQFPYKISSIFGPSLTAIPQEYKEPTKSKKISSINKELHQYIENLSGNHFFSGNVLIAKNGGILFQQSYGKASKEFDVPNNKETKFIIGSINKMFTAVAMLQLYEQRKIALDEPLSKYLPGVLRTEVENRITINHLLTHTSGLGDFLFTNKIMEFSRSNYRSISDYLPFLANDTLRFEPGTKWFYSNAGFLLLGAVIEKVSGLSYEDYVSQNIFAPAAMHSSGFPELDLVPERLASHYEKEFISGKTRFRNDRYSQPAKGTPAGGGVSTTTDLFYFTQALISNKLMHYDLTREMITAKPEYNSPEYGYGIQIFDSKRIGHTGGGPGTWAWVEVNLPEQLTIIVLANQNSGTGTLVRRIRELYKDN